MPNLYKNELDQEILDTVSDSYQDSCDIDGFSVKNFLHNLSSYGYTVVEIEPVHMALKELGEMLSDLGGCDHSVGICQCGIEYNLRNAAETLGEPFYDGNGLEEELKQ